MSLFPKLFTVLAVVLTALPCFAVTQQEAEAKNAEAHNAYTTESQATATERTEHGRNSSSHAWLWMDYENIYKPLYGPNLYIESQLTTAHYHLGWAGGYLDRCDDCLESSANFLSWSDFWLEWWYYAQAHYDAQVSLDYISHGTQDIAEPVTAWWHDPPYGPASQTTVEEYNYAEALIEADIHIQNADMHLDNAHTAIHGAP